MKIRFELIFLFGQLGESRVRLLSRKVRRHSVGSQTESLATVNPVYSVFDFWL